MENKSNTYKCEKCGNTLLKSNKLLHDLKCTSFNNNLNLFQNNYQINNNFTNVNELDYYICEKCGNYLNLKDKADHILCHQLEEDNNKNIGKYNNDNNTNIVNNININFINNINENRINQNNGISNNINFFDDDEDEDEFDKNNLIENEEIEDNEEHELYSYEDEFESDDDENGIDENTINKFPISKIKDINKLTEEKKKCCICLENFKINDETMILPCIHIFHSNCIKAWMKRQLCCPICKNKIT